MPAKQRRMDQLQARRGCETQITVVTADATDQPTTFEHIYVGGAGDITLTPADGGADVVYKAVPVGTVLPARTRRIKATGTTATLMIGMA